MNPADLTDEELDRLESGCKGNTLVVGTGKVLALIQMARRARTARKNQLTMIQDHMEELVGIATAMGMGPYVPIGDSYGVDCHADQIKAKCVEVVKRVGELEKDMSSLLISSTRLIQQLNEAESQLATLRAERDKEWKPGEFLDTPMTATILAIPESSSPAVRPPHN